MLNVIYLIVMNYFCQVAINYVSITFNIIELFTGNLKKNIGCCSDALTNFNCIFQAYKYAVSTLYGYFSFLFDRKHLVCIKNHLSSFWVLYIFIHAIKYSLYFNLMIKTKYFYRHLLFEKRTPEYSNRKIYHQMIKSKAQTLKTNFLFFDLRRTFNFEFGICF